MNPAGASPLPSPRRIRALQQRLLAWYEDNRRDLPWRRTTDPYAILVSEIMLQQTQVPRVTPRFAEWLGAWPDAREPRRGAARRRAPALAGPRLQQPGAAAAGVRGGGRRRRDGRPPGGAAAHLDGLRALPGIGPYTARAVLVFAHNDDLAAVDANVRRVLTHELGLPGDLSDAELQAVADAVLPRGRSRDWHNALMDYGSLVLTARATGIAPRTRQSAFEGSRRQKRARLLRRLLDAGPQSLAELSAALGQSLDETADLVERLRRDGLVTEAGGTVNVA